MIPPGAFLQVTEEAKPGFEKAFLRADSRDRGQHGTRAEMWGYHYDYRSAAATAVKSTSHQKHYLVHASLDQLGLVDTGCLSLLVLHVSVRPASASVADWGLVDLRWAMLVAA